MGTKQIIQMWNFAIYNLFLVIFLLWLGYHDWSYGLFHWAFFSPSSNGQGVPMYSKGCHVGMTFGVDLGHCCK
jgi:hypothetical protein